MQGLLTGEGSGTSAPRPAAAGAVASGSALSAVSSASVGAAGAATPGSRPAAAPTSTNAAPVVIAPSTNVDPHPVSTTAIVGAQAAAATTMVAATTSTAEDAQRAAAQRQQQNQQHFTRTLTRETKLGDALARSKLPDAIVEAQLKQELFAAGTATGLSAEQAREGANQFIQSGTLTDDLRNSLSSRGSELAPGTLSHMGLPSSFAATPGWRGRVAQDAPVEDFIYRGDGVRGNITPIDTADQFYGARPGGAIDQATRGGGGGNVNINIYGDERRVFDVVKRVLRESGIAPTRQRSNA